MQPVGPNASAVAVRPLRQSASGLRKSERMPSTTVSIKGPKSASHVKCLRMASHSWAASFEQGGLSLTGAAPRSLEGGCLAGFASLFHAAQGIQGVQDARDEADTTRMLLLQTSLSSPLFPILFQQSLPPLQRVRHLACLLSPLSPQDTTAFSQHGQSVSSPSS